MGGSAVTFPSHEVSISALAMGLVVAHVIVEVVRKALPATATERPSFSVSVLLKAWDRTGRRPPHPASFRRFTIKEPRKGQPSLQKAALCVVFCSATEPLQLPGFCLP